MCKSLLCKELQVSAVDSRTGSCGVAGSSGAARWGEAEGISMSWAYCWDQTGAGFR